MTLDIGIAQCTRVLRNTLSSDFIIGLIGGAINFCLQKSRMPMAGLVYFHRKINHDRERLKIT